MEDTDNENKAILLNYLSYFHDIVGL